MQLDRALAYESRGQGFESSQARHSLYAYRIFLQSNMIAGREVFPAHFLNQIYQLKLQSAKFIVYVVP